MVEGRPALVGSMLTYKKKEKGGVGGRRPFSVDTSRDARYKRPFFPIEEQLKLGQGGGVQRRKKGGEWARERDGRVVG
jgi:hypothetical protein